MFCRERVLAMARWPRAHNSLIAKWTAANAFAKTKAIYRSTETEGLRDWRELSANNKIKLAINRALSIYEPPSYSRPQRSTGWNHKPNTIASNCCCCCFVFNRIICSCNRRFRKSTLSWRMCQNDTCSQISNRSFCNFFTPRKKRDFTKSWTIENANGKMRTYRRSLEVERSANFLSFCCS